MLKLKSSARIEGWAPEMVFAAVVVDAVYRKHGCNECVVTSGVDGVHGPNSLHDDGEAGDFRTRDLIELGIDIFAVRDEVAEALGSEFDVVLEDPHGPNSHLHVEFDPR